MKKTKRYYKSNRGNTIKIKVVYPEKNDPLTMQTIADVLAHIGILPTMLEEDKNKSTQH